MNIYQAIYLCLFWNFRLFSSSYDSEAILQSSECMLKMLLSDFKFPFVHLTVCLLCLLYIILRLSSALRISNFLPVSLNLLFFFLFLPFLWLPKISYKTFFLGDWSWNLFYGHSLPSADSRRAVVSFFQMCTILVNLLRGLSLPSKCVVR